MYTVEFSNVQGYLTQGGQTGTLPHGGAIEFNSYQPPHAFVLVGEEAVVFGGRLRLSVYGGTQGDGNRVRVP